MDACRARGRDIIIIATEMGVNGGPVTRRYLNVPASPNTSPVSCMSPSDIVLKTGSPSSLEGENIFNFRGASEWHCFQWAVDLQRRKTDELQCCHLSLCCSDMHMHTKIPLSDAVTSTTKLPLDHTQPLWWWEMRLGNRPKHARQQDGYQNKTTGFILFILFSNSI